MNLRKLKKYLKDGEIEALKEIAEITGGQFFRATDNKSLQKVYQEIDELEKGVIYESFGKFVKEVTNESFNADFGLATRKFIELKNEESRQKQYEDSLMNIKNSEEINSDQLLELLRAFIDIANADEFIHENEVVLIQNAAAIWELDVEIKKPKYGDRLTILE